MPVPALLMIVRTENNRILYNQYDLSDEKDIAVFCTKIKAGTGDPTVLGQWNR